jgi:arabinofuranosyltransferase
MPKVSSRSIKLHHVILIALASLYLGWAVCFIGRSAIETTQGRYFCLFDDAMVSLRYAWNLAHGDGLVWNPGERVEGITSLLWTLYMALGALLFDKPRAALFVQLTGIPLVLGVAWMARALIAELSAPSGVFADVPASQSSRATATPGTRAEGLLGPLEVSRDLGVYAAGAVLAYYPLSYWSLLGMETGLLTALAMAALLLAIRLGSDARGSQLLGLLLGLMFATRPDAALPAATLLAFRAAWILLRHRRLRVLGPWLVEVAVVTGIAAGLTLFRWTYYGSPVPNTYYLKLAGWPLHWRLHNGWRFVVPFLDASRYVLFLAFCSVAFHRDGRRLLLLCFGGSVLAGQIWMGGDAWPYWRLLVPGVVVLIVLALDGASHLVRWLLQTERRSLVAGLSLLSAAAAVGAADQPFLGELRQQTPAYTVRFNQSTVQAGLELARYADPRASVAVASAGAVPYYSGLRGVDVLGKSDPYIARLKGDGVDGQTVTPGHNKYDLHYSIERLQPDAIYDALSLSRRPGNDIFEFVRSKYVQRGSFWLRRDSPYIRWDRVPPI